MNPIKTSDLYKHDDTPIQAAIEQLLALDKAMEQISTQIKNNEEVAKSLDKTMKGLSSTTAKGKAAITSQATSIVKLSKQQKELNLVASNTRKKIAENTVALQKNSQVLKNTAKQAASAVGSYNHMAATYALNKIKLNALTQAQIQNTASGRKLLSETKALQVQMDKYQKSTGRHVHSIGNYGIAVKNVRRSLQNLAFAYIGIGAAQKGLRFIVDTTAELDSLRFASEKVIETQGEQIQTMEFLADLTERYGSDIIRTTRAYIKYKAAIKDSNISSQQGQKIFESFTKSSAALGLTTERTELVFLALEQMISKGTVSSEELRRQLGEQLPGSVSIMASSMGVGVAELGKMLKKGEVLTAEVLPNFAKALEKAYGIEGVKQIDTLRAAQGRLSNAFVDLVKNVDVTKWLKDFYSNMAIAAKWVAKNFNSIVLLSKAIGSLVVGITAFNAAQFLLNTNIVIGTSSTAANTAAKVANKVATDALAVSQGNLNKVVKLNPYAIAVGALVALSIWLASTRKKVDRLKEALSETSKAQEGFIEDISGRIAKLTEAAFNTENTYEQARAIDALNKSLKDLDLIGLIDPISTEDIKDGSLKTKVELIQQIEESQARIADYENRIDKNRRDVRDLAIQGLGEKNTTTFTKGGEPIITTKLIRETKEYKDHLQSLLDERKVYEKDLNALIVKEGFIRSDLNANKLLKDSSGSIVTADDDKVKKSYRKQQLEINAMTDKHLQKLAQLELDHQKNSESSWNEHGQHKEVLQTIYNNKVTKENERHDKETFTNNQKAQKAIIDLMADGQEKELALLELNYAKKRFNQGDSAALVEAQARDILKINDKYFDISKAKNIKAAQDTLKVKKQELGLLGLTEEQFRVASLKLDLEFLKFKLVAAQASGDINDLQVQSIKNAIALIEKEIGTVGGSDKPKDIFDLLGIDLGKGSDEQKEMLAATLSYLSEYVDGVVEQYDRILSKAQEVTDDAKTRMEEEKALMDAGSASQYEAAKRDYEQAKQLEAKALADKKKAQQAQAIINNLTAASNIAVAVSELYALNPVVGVLLGTALIGSFIAAKAQSFKAATEEYGDGGGEFLDFGGSHASGNDIDMGTTKDGKKRRAERGEYWSIINKRSTAKYRGELPRVTESLNKGTFHKDYQKASAASDRVVMPSGDNYLSFGGSNPFYVVLDEKGEFKEKVTIQ